jgi:hypothetical protein
VAIISLAVRLDAAHLNSPCREAFFMALDLVKELSARSHVGRRLWRTIEHLKTIGSKLGILLQQIPQYLKSSSTAKNALGSLGGGSADDNKYNIHRAMVGNQNIGRNHAPLKLGFSTSEPLGSEVSPSNIDPIDGNQISRELKTLFSAIEPTNGLAVQSDADNLGLRFLDFGIEEDLSRLW